VVFVLGVLLDPSLVSDLKPECRFPDLVLPNAIIVKRNLGELSSKARRRGVDVFPPQLRAC
jgi:hypothetical protein